LINYFEEQNGIVDRKAPNGVYSAMIFGEYTPNPAVFGLNYSLYSVEAALFIEAWGTAVLMFMILALTDDRQKVLVKKELAPFLIGFTVAVLISCYAPITQAGWNPARDFGPRLVSWFAGWGSNAIPGPRDEFWIYIVGPMIGAPLGGLAYDFTITPGLTEFEVVECDPCAACPELEKFERVIPEEQELAPAE
jgi:glycerol uptake facilitator-like aquaporin